jgi:CxxC motif-containing protein (DUF1111 family)
MAPGSLVIRLASPESTAGDPVYGHIFSTSATEGVRSEGAVEVRYTDFYGYYYPFGGRWKLRVPHYRLTGLAWGPLAATTVIEPRVAPTLMGVGLFEAVPPSAIIESELPRKIQGSVAWQLRDGRQLIGRFGWQGATVSIRDQVTSALALEMGLTTEEQTSDDCTQKEVDCRKHRAGNSPKVPPDAVDALVAFIRSIPAPSGAQGESWGKALFLTSGCGDCHRPSLPVEQNDSGVKTTGSIAAYTDLRLHDLGPDMADETVSGQKVPSRWRTAPLWGIGYRLRAERQPAFMHDARASTLEEAILWHSGEASLAKRRFMTLGPRARTAMLQFLESL